MKKIFIISFPVLCLILLGFTEDPLFKITGQVQNRDKGTVILFQYDETDFQEIESPVVNGNFSFEGNRKLPEHFAIEYIAPGSKRKFESFKFFIEPTAKVNIMLFPDSISKSLISGSKIASDFLKVNQFTEIRRAEGLKKMFGEYEKALANKDSFQLKIILQKRESLLKEILNWKLDYVENNPTSFISAYLINSIYNSTNIEILKQYYSLLDKSVLDSRYSKHLKYFLSTAPGNRFPDFELPDSNNNLHKFSEISKDKVVLVDFWGTWCKACREQNAKLASIYDLYKGKGFEIVGISVDKDIKTFRNTIQKDNMSWLNFIDRTDERSVLKTIFTPTHYPSNILINRKGIITHKDVNLSELEEKIKGLLK